LQGSAGGTPSDFIWSLEANGTTTPLGHGATLNIPWSQLLAAGVVNGTYTLDAAVSYQGVLYNTVQGTLVVNPTPPTLLIAGPATVDEGTTYTATLAGTDLANQPITSWIINWGDGQTSTLSGNPTSATHTYTQHGSYTISTQATEAS